MTETELTGICPSCEEQRPNAISEEFSFVPGSVCPNCGHVETEDESEPLQFHYVVFGEKTEDGIRWSIDIDSSLLDNGSVFDPSAGWGEGWSCVDGPEQEQIDNELVVDLERRLNARVVG